MNTRLVRILFGLVALSALLFAGFFGIGQLIPVVDVAAKVVIPRPVDKVFSAFNDPFDRMDWQEGFEGTERVSGAQGVPGSISTVFFTHGDKKFEMREELKVYGANEIVEVVLSSDLFTQHMKVTFSAIDSSSTQLIMTGTVTGSSWFFRSMMGLAKERLQQQEQQNFIRLKQLLESR